MFRKFINQLRFDEDEFFAYRWKFPDSIQVCIESADDGYFARITNLSDVDNVVTQANSGKELVEMVNELLYDYLEIPSQYRGRYGYFLPNEDIRKTFELKIPKKYLNKELSLALN